MWSYLKAFGGFVILTLVGLVTQVIFTDNKFDETILGKIVSIILNFFNSIWGFLTSSI